MSEELDAVSRIEESARDGIFGIASGAMQGTVEDLIYHEDIERAMKRPRHLGSRVERGRPVFLFTGPGIDEAPIVASFRLLKRGPVGLAAARVPEPPFRN